MFTATLAALGSRGEEGYMGEVNDGLLVLKF
jgi:hypothetical protein